MREILFRGKCLDNGEWVQGFYFERKNTEGKIIEAVIIEDMYQQVTGGIRYMRSDLHKECFQVDTTTVGQFTGYTVNGTKVFEGDIISVFDVDENHGVTEFIGEVFMDSGSWLVSQSNTCDWYLHDLRDGRHSLVEVKVIGNIHDNPELIGGTDNEKQ